MEIKSYWCKEDLTPYVDSMLFDSGEEIANMKCEDGDDKFELSLRVVGDVNVYYKDERYRYPSDFPDELKELIKENRWWDTYAPSGEGNDNEEPLIYVDNNNWFECIYYHDNDKKDIAYTDGIMYEADLSEDTPDGIKEWFIEIVNDILSNCK